jgi:hypothetical protein
MPEAGEEARNTIAASDSCASPWNQFAFTPGTSSTIA